MNIARIRLPDASTLYLSINPGVRRVVLADSPNGCFYVIVGGLKVGSVSSLGVLELHVKPGVDDADDQFVIHDSTRSAVTTGEIVDGIAANLFNEVTIYLPVGLTYVKILNQGELCDVSALGGDLIDDQRIEYDAAIQRAKNKALAAKQAPNLPADPEPKFTGDEKIFTDGMGSLLLWFLVALVGAVIVAILLRDAL